MKTAFNNEGEIWQAHFNLLEHKVSQERNEIKRKEEI